MFQVQDIRKGVDGQLYVDILLDDSKAGDPNFVVSLTFPPPSHGAALDTHLQSQLAKAAPGLAATLAIRTAPPFDPFKKWKGFKWTPGTTPTIPT